MEEMLLKVGCIPSGCIPYILRKCSQFLNQQRWPRKKRKKQVSNIYLFCDEPHTSPEVNGRYLQHAKEKSLSF